MKRILKFCGLIIITNIIFSALVSLAGLKIVVLGTLSYLVLKEFELI